MDYVRERNPKLNPRYETLAREYKRSGEALHVRWDYAFFQMLLETGYLTYGGDVKPEQNNFAGLGATGNGARGESFKDIATGARAHLEHLLMYSGEHVENPVAERTRNIQEWGVLTDWQKGISTPITFKQLAAKWAPGSRRYAADIEGIADRFFDGKCKEPDPDGQVVASADDEPASEKAPPAKTRGLDAQAKAKVTAEAPAAKAPTATADDAAAGDGDVLPAKGAAAVAAAASEAKDSKDKSKDAKAGAPVTTASATVPPVTMLNAAPQADAPAADETAPPVADKTAGKAKAIEVAALPGGLNAAGQTQAKTEKSAEPKQSETKQPDKKQAGKAETPKADKKSDKAAKKDAAASGKCRVWTASYGGSKAIIIKATADKTVNYTVLDVNEGAEKREADAYINAYAKGGESVGEFSNQSQALEKAFELCPEG